ncbi:ribosomal protection-like ABC-F family protein [Brachyspira pulli]|uniref:ribosomal protection-like ABC-F family protein n=1 Tax=Brachyspira pulli TaxID=310721 RepID=UPI0024C7FB51|nr:ABC-F type ribosomal protection protein Tva(D) [Brachyspira pulli]
MFIKFNKVSFSYDSSDNILNDVSFHIDNSCTAIVGENGAGKTTLAKLITGLLKPSSGSIDYSNKNVISAYCNQECVVLPDNAENLFYDDSSYSGYLISIFKLDCSYLYRFDTLSFGERKRLQIASALYTNPDILVLDEPTNHIDNECKDMLINIIKRLECIVIIISHDIDFLNELVSKCIFIRNGNCKLRIGNYSQCREYERNEEDYQISLYEESKKKTKILENRYKKLQNESDTKKSKCGSKRNIDKKDHDAKGKVDAARLTGKDSRLATKAKQAKSLYNKSVSDKENLYIKKREVLNMEFIGEKYKGKFLFYLAESEKTVINNIILKHSELLIERDSKIGIQGVNGCGKTTLVNYIISTMKNNNIEKIVYIPQDIDRDEWNKTFNSIKSLDYESLGFLMSFVNRLGSNPKSVINSSNHSPGEMRKIMLGLSVLQNPYIIILDEPTNHLDIDSIERLEEALISFNCALLIVSHNKNFLKNTVNTFWNIELVNKYSVLNVKNTV